jgi:methyl-accepting chemotaxis protein
MQRNILLAILAVVSLPLASLWYTNIYKLQEGLENQINQDLIQTAEVIATRIDDWTEMNLKLLEQNSSLAQIKSGLEEQQKPILESMVHTYDWLYLAYAIGPGGYKTARSDDKPIINPDGSKAHFRGDRSYFRQIKSGAKTGQQLLLSRTLGKPAFILCNEIANPGAMLLKKGALCIGATVSELSESVVNTKIGKTGYAVLIDSFSRVIAHGKPEAVTEQLQDIGSDPMVVRATPGEPYTYYSGDTRKVAYMKPVGSNWHLIVEQDYDDAYSALSDAKLGSLILLVATLTMSVVISFLVARFVAAPLQRLTGIANEISRGKFQNKLPESTRKDEIGELAKAIEKMSISISMAMKQLRGG